MSQPAPGDGTSAAASTAHFHTQRPAVAVSARVFRTGHYGNGGRQRRPRLQPVAGTGMRRPKRWSPGGPSVSPCLGGAMNTGPSKLSCWPGGTAGTASATSAAVCGSSCVCRGTLTCNGQPGRSLPLLSPRAHVATNPTDPRCGYPTRSIETHSGPSLSTAPFVRHVSSKRCSPRCARDASVAGAEVTSEASLSASPAAAFSSLRASAASHGICRTSARRAARRQQRRAERRRPMAWARRPRTSSLRGRARGNAAAKR